MISPWFLPRAFLKDFENIFSAIPYTFMNGEGLGSYQVVNIGVSRRQQFQQ